jgi:hypothetical protein
MIRGGRRLFPVSLYAMLLAALCCIAAPDLARPVQGWCLWVLCLPLRTWAVLMAEPKATPALDRTAAASADVLQRRLHRAAVADIAGLLPPGLEPVVCAVVDRGEIDAAGLPSALWLDRTVAETADCLDIVTYGDALLGFLAPADAALGAAGQGAPVRVDLLHAARPGRGPRRVPCAVQTSATLLRFVAEPAGRIDRWPLRGTLFEQPYAASRLDHSGDPVRTTALAGDPLGALPAGLRVGTLQVWGYPGREHPLPIGLYVQPALDPRAISAVVLWRPRRPVEAPAPRLAAAEQRSVQLLAVPAPPPATERWVLTASSREVLPRGAALVRGAAVFGVVEQSGPGFALAAPFGRSRQLWSLLLLPDAPELPPIELLARGVRRDSAHLCFRSEAARGPLPAGLLFTGANGPHCPPGLLIGRAVPDGASGDLVVAPMPVYDGAFAVCIGREVAP